MQIRKGLFVAILGAIVVLPYGAFAQDNSINTFSPYTMYGLGDFATQGPASLRSMGGAGVAYRSPYMTNFLNPASVGAIGRKSFLFNFGMEGQDFYLKTDEAKNLHNTFNIRDISIAFPLAKNIGFMFSATPFSRVGYKMEEYETDPDIIADLGNVKYTYIGQGNITQFKAGIGSKVSKKLYVGAEAMFLKGSLDRYFRTTITPLTTTGYITNATGNDNTAVSKVYANLGAIYNIISEPNRDLSLGATYRFGGNLNADVTRYIPSNNYMVDTVALHNYTSDLALPSNLTIGVSYNTLRYGINADYTFQDWGGKNSTKESSLIQYRNTNSVKLGFLYVPQQGDIRSYARRISYRVGVRYEDYYMKINGQNLSDKAITFGLGLPIKQGLSNVNLGFEVGQRGTTNQSLIKENYFRFSLEFSLFGEDDWFRQFKIN